MLRGTVWAGGLVAVVAVVAVFSSAAASAAEAILVDEFLYETAPFPSCHASTIAETPAGLACAWFGGKDEGDVSVGIWLARQSGDEWTPPVEVADGVSDDGKRYPCWNPVLFQPAEGPLILFYKVGPSPSTWWGMRKMSEDGGRTWSEAVRLPDGILGPVRNKPIEIELGVLLCGSSTEHDQPAVGARWRVHMERVVLDGWEWTKTEPLNSAREIDAIQPTILEHGGKRLQILCRTRQRRVAESWSDDNGRTWSDLELIELPNPSSGIDGVTLADGRHLLVYNPTERGRSPLSVAISADGKSWRDVVVLEDEPGEYSYPAVMQTKDGKVHTTYTWKRERIKHVVLDPAKLGE